MNNKIQLKVTLEGEYNFIAKTLFELPSKRITHTEN